MPEVRYSDTWNHRNFQNMTSYEGVNVYDDHVLWYCQVSPDWAGSAANEQSFLDFLQRGPSVTVPPEIAAQVRDVILKIVDTQR